mgnify:CR=1 FL=1|jgi:secretion/DNA translocation related TadE-like protein
MNRRWVKVKAKRGFSSADDSGSATLAMLAVLVVGMLAVIGVARMGSAATAKARADAAADAVALAGADQIALGKDQGLARRAAQETARDNGARFISGRFSETFVTVRVGIQTLGIEAIGQARAEVRTECRLGCPRD